MLLHTVTQYHRNNYFEYILAQSYIASRLQIRPLYIVDFVPNYVYGRLAIKMSSVKRPFQIIVHLLTY